MISILNDIYKGLLVMLPISYEYEYSICEIKTKENVLLAVGMIKRMVRTISKFQEKTITHYN